MILLLLFSIGLYLIASILPLILIKWPLLAKKTTAIVTLLAAIISLPPTIYVLLTNLSLELISPWYLPVGSFHIKMDQISAWFNIPLSITAGAVCLYGLGYRKNEVLGIDGFGSFLSILLGGMFLVLIAWDGILFLFVWELMSFAAFFLVIHNHEKKEVRRAGWIYLAATHLGTAFLFGMFIFWGNQVHSFDFDQFTGIKEGLNLIFLLSLVGFGSKAGFFGLHVWLPEAHPAAPSVVSGIMSGIMIKMGIYGILRVLTLMSQWKPWWGALVIILGVLSGLGGSFYSLIQRDYKRMLAYCSVENIGIICLGIGLGIIGVYYHQPTAVFGFAGALFHVLNHAIFKTGLFMGAGSVLHVTHTRTMDLLGGLQSKMPVTAFTFLLFSAAICGLPPLNGFASEIFIYLSALTNLTIGTSLNGQIVVSLIVLASMALMGGLSLYGFIKLFGTLFLGQPRSQLPPMVQDPGFSMKIPMLILAGICIVLGVGAYFPAKIVLYLATLMVPFAQPLETTNINLPDLFWAIPLFTLGIIFLIWSLRLLKRSLQKSQTIKKGPLWGCGYNRPNSRMQYTGASFSEPIENSFQGMIEIDHERVIDPCMNHFWSPIFKTLHALFTKIRKIQHGRISLYILYIVFTLISVLIWSCLS